LERHDFTNCASGGVIQYSLSYISNIIKSDEKVKHILYCDARNYGMFSSRFNTQNVDVRKIQITNNAKLDKIIWFLILKNIIAIFGKYDLFTHHNGIYINPFKRKGNHIIIHNVQPLLWKRDENLRNLIRLNLLHVCYLLSFTFCQKVIFLNDALCLRLKQHHVYWIWKKKFEFSAKNLGLPKVKVKKRLDKKIAGKINLCYVSTFNDYKNHKFLFKCIDSSKSDVSICCIGVDENDKKFKKLIENYSLSINHFIVSPEVVGQELVKFDGLLFMSSVENLPKTIFDYALVEKPMLVLKIPEIFDIFEDSNIVWLAQLNEDEFMIKFKEFLSMIRKGKYIHYKTADKYAD